MSMFAPATRNQIPLKIGLTGPSGSGKTLAALRLARGLVGPNGRIAVADTENGSASLYANETAFQTLAIGAPYKVAKFIAAINGAVAEGFGALVMDSASHEWIQILQDKEAMDARGGNQWTNWASFTKEHELFLTAIRNAPLHLILCLRAKEKHEMNEAKKVVKVGLGAQTRDGFEYELTTVFDLAMDHNYKVSKDRTRLFDGRMEQITVGTGEEFVKWLQSGAELAPEPNPAPAPATATHGTATPAAPAAQRATTPRAQGAAHPVAQGAVKPATPTNQAAPRPTQAPAEPSALSAGAGAASATAEPPAEWVEAMVELAEVSMGLPEPTRKALIAGFEADGPAALKAVKEEIAKLRFILDPAPTTPGGVISSMPMPEGAPVSQAASDFVDGMADGPEAAGCITPEQYEALNNYIKAFGINRDALRSYMFKAGHLLPGANGPTLARMKTEEFVKLRDKLANQTIAAKGETWSQRTVRIINSTPVTTYQPIPAAS